MIHEVHGHFVLSHRNTWRPGSFESKRAARLAQKLDDECLQRLQDAAIVRGGNRLIRELDVNA